MSSDPTPTVAEIHAEIDRWFAEEIQRAPISWATECYNQAQAAFLSLKCRIAALIEPATEAATSAVDAAAADVRQATAPAAKKTKPAV